MTLPCDARRCFADAHTASTDAELARATPSGGGRGGPVRPTTAGPQPGINSPPAGLPPAGPLLIRSDHRWGLLPAGQWMTSAVRVWGSGGGGSGLPGQLSRLSADRGRGCRTGRSGAGCRWPAPSQWCQRPPDQLRTSRGSRRWRPGRSGGACARSCHRRSSSSARIRPPRGSCGSRRASRGEPVCDLSTLRTTCSFASRATRRPIVAPPHPAPPPPRQRRRPRRGQSSSGPWPLWRLCAIGGAAEGQGVLTVRIAASTGLTVKL